MRTPNLSYKKLVLVCTNVRGDGTTCCDVLGGAELYHALKQALKAADPTIRVSQTGCLGNCLSGPVVVIMPDNIWLGEVTRNDIPKIIRTVTS